MNAPYDTSGIVEKTGQDPNSDRVNADPMSAAAPVPVDTAQTHQTTLVANPSAATTLLNRELSEHFRSRWSEIQARFVDEPRMAVQQADALVTEVIDQITKMFDQEHSTLEGQWNQGSNVSTEDLRQALQHYRSFFNRLVV